MAPEPGMMTEAVSPVAPCVAWRCGNKDECNREEGNCCYPSHFYLTTTRMVDPRQIGVKRRLGSVGFETDKEIKSVSASTPVRGVRREMGGTAERGRAESFAGGAALESKEYARRSREGGAGRGQGAAREA